MKRSSAAQLVVAVELPVIIAIAPLLLFPTPGRLLALLIVPLIWGSARVATGRFVPSTPLNVPIYLLLAMVGLSIWTTFDITLSLGKVSGVILGALLFWAVVRWITTTVRLAVGVAAFVAAGATLAIVGLLGTEWTDKFTLFSSVIASLPRVIRGVPGADVGFNANAVAGCLILFVPLQIALLVARASRRVCVGDGSRSSRHALFIVQVALLALTGGTLLLLQSRGAWLGLMVASVACAILRPGLSRALGLSAVVAALVSLQSGWLGSLAVSGSRSGLQGIADRFEIWTRALYGIRDFPFTGMGMNTFRKVMPVLYPSSMLPPTMDVVHAHNHLLQAALDLGVPGLIGYLAVWLVTASLIAVTCRRARDAMTRAAAGGLGAGLFAHFVFGLTDAIPLGAKVGVLFWLALGLAVALFRVGLAQPSPTASAAGPVEP